jgi:hypothetical protein
MMRKIISLCIVLALLLCLPFAASAAKVDGTLSWQGNGTMIIYVEWDVEKPAIKFTDPNGRTYDPAVAKDGTNAVVVGKIMYYQIDSPTRGTWRYSYEQGNNTSVNVYAKAETNTVEVESFTVGELNGTQLPVSFRASGPSNQTLQYTISLTADGAGGQRDLCRGATTANKDTDLVVDLGRLSSYDGYKLRLHIYYNDGDLEIYDDAYSNAFAYTNPDADANQPSFTVTIRPDEYMVYVDWTLVTWGADSVTVAIFEDGGDPYFDTFENPAIEGSTKLSFSPDTKVVELELSAKIDGVSTSPVRKTMNLADMMLTCGEEKAINYVNYPITYTNTNKTVVKVAVGEQSEYRELTGTGVMNIALTDGWNQLAVEYTDAGGVIWQIGRELYVDRDAPVLRMSQDYEGIAIKGNKVTISGSTIDATQVLINGEAATLGADGLFSKELTLQPGENTITVSALDSLGNEARYTAIVYSGEVTEQTDDDQQGFMEKLLGGGYWVLLISGVFALLVVGYGLIFWRKEKKDETV